MTVGFFADFLGGIDYVRKVKPDDLRRFIIALQMKTRWSGRRQGDRRTLSANSINSYVRGIKQFWGWLAREGPLKKNLLAEVPAPKLPKALPETDLIKLLSSKMNLRERVIVELLLDSGIRLSELLGIEMADIDLEAGSIKVFGKGAKERMAFISPKTAAKVGAYIHYERPQPAAADKLLLTRDGYPMNSNRVQKILEAVGRRAGLGHRLSPHKLRHSYASLSLKYGANLEYVRRTLGHSDIKTSEIYLEVADADIAKAHRVFAPMVNLVQGRNRR